MKKLFIAVIAALLCLSSEAIASHFRYGNITWTRVAGQPNTMHFVVTQAWRSSAYFGFGNTPTVGATTPTDAALEFGDGTFANVTITVTSVNAADDWFYGTFEVNHTYLNPGNYTAQFTNCCRISNLSNNADGTYLISSLVQVGAANDAPVSNIPPIINMPAGSAGATFQINSTDPNAHALTYSMTPNGSFGPGSAQPSGISISSSGLITFNTVGKANGSLWNASVDVVDQLGAKVQLDFIIQLNNNVGNPPVITSPTNQTTYNLCPGQPVSFPVTATDPDANATITINGVGIPPGANFTPVSPGAPSPANTSFSWTPTLAQVGNYVLDFVATDNNLNQAHAFVSINVSLNGCNPNTGPFFTGSTPTDGSTINNCLGAPVGFTVSAGDANLLDMVTLSSYDLPVGANFTAGTNPGNPAVMNFSWTPTAGSTNIHFVATDGTLSDTTVVTIASATCCSYSQGGYGNAGGMDCNGTTLVSTTSLLTSLIGTGMMVGEHGTRSVDIEAAADVLATLPGGGNSGIIPLGHHHLDALPSSMLKKGRINNALLAQTITLGLNLRNGAGLADVPIMPGSIVTQQSGGCGSTTAVACSINNTSAKKAFALPASVTNYLGSGATIGDLYMLANNALGGVVTPGNGGVPSFSAINDAVDAINNAFHGCRIYVGYNAPLCPSFRMTGGIVESGFNVYPNPSDGTYFISLPAPDQKAEILVTDLAGKTVTVQAVAENYGKEVRLDLKGASNGVYLLQVNNGGQVYRTKLIVQ